MDIELLNNWNPWWTSKEVPNILKGRTRSINHLIFKVLKEKEVIALTGIRRCGKTTIMYQMIEVLLKSFNESQILYINLDDELLKKESLETIYTTYKQYKNPELPSFIFLDEIQNIDEWERFIKKYYDLNEKVKFVVSGSSASLLKGEFSTLLTGRNITFTIMPLSFREFVEFANVNYNNDHNNKTDYKEITSADKIKIFHELVSFFEYCGFPEVYFKEPEIKKILLKQYFDDIIYKDIVKRHNVNAKKVIDLALYLLTNFAASFTIRKIRNFTGLSIDSIKDYISYVEDSYMIILVDHFSYSLKEQATLTKKVYTLDCGLRNTTAFKFSSDIGRLAENIVCVELKRRGENIYYWKGKSEVDFVIKNNDNTLTAINVTYSDKIDNREIAGLEEFSRKFTKTKKMIILTKDIEEKKGQIHLIPLWKWLLH